MKLLTSAITRITLRRRTHAFARSADVGSHPYLSLALAIALFILMATGSAIGVVAFRPSPAMHTHAQSGAPLATAAAALTLPEHIPDFSPDTSRPNARSEVVFNRRDAIAIICLAVWL